MRKSLWDRFIHSWWGRSLAGAMIGGFIMAFANVNSGPLFLLGMAAGALALFLLGRWE